MSFTAYSLNTLLEMQQSLKEENTAMLDQFYPTLVLFDTPSISLDIEVVTRTLANFQHPSLPGQMVRSDGYRTKSLTPAYLKPKETVAPWQAFERQAGEAFNGDLTPQQRFDAAVMLSLKKQRAAIRRRMELMAVSALVHGQLTIEGPGYPVQTVNFERDASLQAAQNTLSGAARWTQTSTSRPLDDLDIWNLKSGKAEGGTILDYVFSVDAWALFHNHPKVERKLELVKYDFGQLQSLQPMQAGLQLRGHANGYRLWTYVGWYVNSENNEVEAFTGNRLLGIGDIGGKRLHGAIADHKAGLRALEFFPKMWEEEDPPAMNIMTQSAPLPAPTRPNASISCIVTSES